MDWLTPQLVISIIVALFSSAGLGTYVAKSFVEIKAKTAATLHVEAQTRQIEAESNALIDAEQTRINAQTFADLRADVVVLRSEIVTLRGEVLTLNNAYQKERIDSQGFKLNWEEALRLLGERNHEIAELKETIEKLREQLTKYIEKTMRSQDTITSAADTKLLRETKADLIEAAAEQANDETDDK